jgi:hypothetical protein
MGVTAHGGPCGTLQFDRLGSRPWPPLRGVQRASRCRAPGLDEIKCPQRLGKFRGFLPKWNSRDRFGTSTYDIQDYKPAFSELLPIGSGLAELGSNGAKQAITELRPSAGR